MIKPTNENCDYQGKYGRVWRMRIENMEDGPKKDLTKAGYLIWAPGHSPICEYFLLAAISLEDYPGVEPVTRYLPSATHEVFLMTLLPEKGMPEHGVGPIDIELDNQLLTVGQPNYVGQGVYDSQDLVRSSCLQAAKDLADRVLTPHEVSGWVDRFGDSNIKPEHK